MHAWQENIQQAIKLHEAGGMSILFSPFSSLSPWETLWRACDIVIHKRGNLFSSKSATDAVFNPLYRFRAIDSNVWTTGRYQRYGANSIRSRSQVCF